MSVCPLMLLLVCSPAVAREEVQGTEASSADSVTCLSDLMMDWNGLPDVDLFGLPIPRLSLEFQEVLS